MSVLLVAGTLFAQAGEFDAVIAGGTVYDGTGAPGRPADVALRGERIAKIGRGLQGKKTIDARGLVVCPGFIDLHTHSDRSITHPDTRSNLNYLMQGLTLAVTGNCGFGPTEVGEYFRKIDQEGAGTHIIHQIPHGSVREKVMGSTNRAPTPRELDRMREIVERGMKDGAFGMSTGLIYVPGVYARTHEIVELAKIVAKHGGHYASHIRNEGRNLLEAIEEAIEIGRQSGCRVHVSHFKSSGREAWGQVKEAAAKIEAAQKAGLKVTADQYPYIASSTSLAANLIPAEYREGGDEKLVQRLADPRIREAVLREFEKRLAPDRIMIANFAADPKYNGKTLAKLAEQTKNDAVDVVLDILRRGGASGIFFGMDEDDVRWVMKLPWVATASDGAATQPGRTHPHPRSYGTFPRKIGRYSIEMGLLPLERAIYSATGLPAEILGLKDRGLLREGYFADVLALDPNTYRDTATFESPHQYATGVRHLWVNGACTIDDGTYTGALAGRALRRRP